MTLEVSLLRPRRSAAKLSINSNDFSRCFYTLFFKGYFNNILSHIPLHNLQPFVFFDYNPYEFLISPIPSEFTAILLSFDIIPLIIGCLVN